MKIDRKKTVNRCGYDLEECKSLAVRLAQCSDEQLLAEIHQIKVWNYGKCELGLWSDVLDRLDGVLENAVTRVGQWTLRVDSPNHKNLVNDVIAILEFTGHLIEHSIYRYLYGSLDYILKLFCSSNMDILLAVLGLFYTFSKRSNYFNRVDSEVKEEVSLRLEFLAESWGGKENGFDLARCCSSDDSRYLVVGSDNFCCELCRAGKLVFINRQQHNAITNKRRSHHKRKEPHQQQRRIH